MEKIYPINMSSRMNTAFTIDVAARILNPNWSETNLFDFLIKHGIMNKEYEMLPPFHDGGDFEPCYRGIERHQPKGELVCTLTLLISAAGLHMLQNILKEENQKNG